MKKWNFKRFICLTILSFSIGVIPILTGCGTDGINGKSAYEIATDNGFVGTETEWLASLKGEQGENGQVGARGEQGVPGINGKGISNVSKLSTNENVDTYRILYTDGTFSTFQITNGKDGTIGKNGVGVSNIDTAMNVDGNIMYLTLTFTLTDDSIIRRIVVIPSESISLATETIETGTSTITIDNQEVEILTVAENTTLSVDSNMQNIWQMQDASFSATIPSGTILENGSTTLTLAIEATNEVSTGTIQVGDGEEAFALDVSIPEISQNNSSIITITIKNALPANLNANNINLYHDGQPMTRAQNQNNLTNNSFYYDSSTGNLIIGTTNFSNFTLILKEFEARIENNSQRYETLADAIANVNDNQTITMISNVQIDNTINISKNISLNLNGHTLTYTGSGNLFNLSNNAEVTINGYQNNSSIILQNTTSLCNLDNGQLNITGGTFNFDPSKFVAAGYFVIPNNADGIINYIVGNNNVFEISSLTDLETFRDMVNSGNNFSGYNIVLTKSITLNNGWTPIGEGARKPVQNNTTSARYAGTAFAGEFNGNGKTIYNLNNIGFTPTNSRLGYDDPNNMYAYGLFALTDTGANIHDLTLSNVNIDTNRYVDAIGDSVAGLVGFSAGSLTVNNVVVSGSILGTDAVGGIIGRAYDQNNYSGDETFTILNCVNNANITCPQSASSKAAGIVGFVGEAPHESTNTITISNCTNNGEINGGMIAGIAVYSYQANNTSANSQLQNYNFVDNTNTYNNTQITKYRTANSNLINANETISIDE